MSESPWHVSVLLPARDEEQLIVRSLHSVLLAATQLPGSVTCDVVVAVDSSSDRTRELAEGTLRGPEVPCEGVGVCTDAGIVGRARALAAEVALARFRGSQRRCWLANTDADSVVPPTWLNQRLALAERGVEAIAGRITIDSFAEHEAMVEERFRSTYLIGADGSHTHVHGANLGVRADAYVRAGGWVHWRRRKTMTFGLGWR